MTCNGLIQSRDRDRCDVTVCNVPLNPADWSVVLYGQGRTQGEGPGDRALPLEAKNTRFPVFLWLNFVICVFPACVLKLFAMWKDRGSL